MSQASEHIIRLADQMGDHLGITHWAVSMRVSSKGDFIRRLKNGGDCHTRTYDRVLKLFDDQWPIDLEWPVDIPRPDVRTIKKGVA